LELARKEKPDLMTLDLSMPGMDGGKVFETLRNDPEIAATRVCIVSGKPELRKLIYERPVPPPEGYLDKPIEEDSFLLNVRKILELADKPEQTTVN
jgi:CheY-like chemotaxis protein